MVEADFQRYYHLDLRHAVNGTGCRRLWALLHNLPSDAAVWREGRRWTQQDELAALQIEHADAWSYIAALAAGVKSKALPKPTPIEHPDRVKHEPRPRERVESDPAQIAAWFSKHMH